jgi:DNA-binding NarL/FixJ family response regulator
MTAVRILIADDHQIVRHGVRAVLERQAGWVVSAEASSGRDAVAKTVDLQPDIVVIDVSMPELNGLDATRQIRRVAAAKVVILTGTYFTRRAHLVSDRRVGSRRARRRRRSGTPDHAPARSAAAAH